MTDQGGPAPTIRVVASSDASPTLLAQVHDLIVQAFEGSFSPQDWEHALGGWHVVAEDDGVVVAHAAVVPRVLVVGRHAFRAGYVEAVATAPARRGRGLGSRVMAQVARLLRERFELGALSTCRHGFYERLGWQRWRGPTFVRDGRAVVRTPHEDAGVMVLRTGPSRDVDLTAPLSCDARPGDDW